MFQALLANWLRQQARGAVWNAVHEAAQGNSGEASEGEESANVQPAPACDLVVLFATAGEAGGFVDRLQGIRSLKCATYVEHIGRLQQRPVCAAETGGGGADAERALRDIVAVHQPRWIVHAGFACGLQASVRRGQFVIARRLINAAGTVLDTGLQFGSQDVGSTWHIGDLVSVDELPRSPAAKRQLGTHSSALACDREAFAVGQICREAKIPLISLRLIQSAVDDDLAPVVKGMHEQGTLAAKLGAATGALLDRPSAAKELWQEKEDALRLSDRLADFLVDVLRQLPA